MADCPECKVPLTELSIELVGKPVGTAELNSGKLVHNYDTSIHDDHIEFVCPKCGAYLTDDDDVAEGILADRIRIE